MTNKQSYAGLLERPFTYAYRYPAWPPDGATVIRFGTNGCEVNGMKPIEAIPLYSAEAISSPLKALRLLRDEIVATEEHGEGAAEDGCPICQAIEQADTALSGEKL